MQEDFISLEELGFTEEDWESVSDDEKDNLMRELAWQCADWGYRLEEVK